MYNRHIDTLTVAIHGPFWQRVRGRPAYVTPRQYRLLVSVYSGYRGTQRELAASTGYTIGGLNDALGQLRSLGLIVLETTRGCLGSTKVRARRGLRVLDRAVVNVRQHLVDLSPSHAKRVNNPASVSEHSPETGFERYLRRGRERGGYLRLRSANVWAQAAEGLPAL